MSDEESAFRHPDPGVLMPRPDTPAERWERMPLDDASEELAKTKKPNHPDNRGMEPSLGGNRHGEGN